MLSFTILKYAYRFTSANIADESVRYGFIREILSYYRLEYKDENEFIGNLLAEISLIKNSRIDIENFYSGVCGEEIFRDIYKNMRQGLRKTGLLILMICSRILMSCLRKDRYTGIVAEQV